MTQFYGSLLIIICLVSCVLSAASTFSSEISSSISSSSHFLNTSPSLFKSDGRPLGTVGVLFYAYQNGIPYILLAREAEDPDKGTYSEFGGNLNLKADGSPENFLEGCIRECQEESAGLYKPSLEDLLQSKIYIETTSNGRQVVLCLIETTHFYQSADLLKAQTKFEDNHFKEKDDLLWVRSDILLTKERSNLTLRPFFKEILMKSDFRQLLEDLNRYQEAA